MTEDDLLREATVLQDHDVDPDRVAAILTTLWAVNCPDERPLTYRCVGERVEVDLPDGDKLVWTGARWKLGVPA